MSRSRLIQYFLIGKTNPIVCIFINNDSVTDDAKYISSCKKLDARILFKIILFLNWYNLKKLMRNKNKTKSYINLYLKEQIICAEFQFDK